jgi:hypothetical protein
MSNSADDYSGVINQYKNEKVRAAAIRAGVRESDVEDVMAITASRFDLGQDGNVIVLGEDGRASGVSVDDYFKTFRSQRPRYFEPAADGKGGQKISRAAFDKMDQPARAKFVAEGGQVAD